MSDIRRMTEKLKKFRDERDWMKFHNHKDMALSLTLEAAEVLEHFQWKSPREVESYGRTHKDQIGEELADVAAYLFELADNLGIDLIKAMEKKIRKNAAKYPVRKTGGRRNKPRETGTAAR